MKRTFALVVSLCLFVTLTTRGEVIFFDDFQQFPSGTALSLTNYLPPAGVSAEFHTNDNLAAGTTVVASNFLGSTRAFFNLASPPYQHSYNGDPLAQSTNQIVTLSWKLWIEAVKFPPSTVGGLAVNLGTTNLFISGSFTNLESNPLILFGDAGQVAVFTNTPSFDEPQASLVQIGSWSNRVGTVMTNQLVLNYPSGTFSFSINSTILTNMPIPAFLSNIFDRVRIDVFEAFTNAAFASTGNRFALDEVRLDNTVVSTNQDVQSYVAAAKGQQFLQLTSGAPTASPTGFAFIADVVATDSNTVLSASVEVPGGETKTLSQDGDTEFAFHDEFTTKGALDAEFTNGVYKLSINTANQGLLLPALDVPGDAYPADAPHITNFTAAQAVDAAADFTLTWDAFSGGTSNDFIIVDIEGPNGGFGTPDFGEPGALNGTETSLLISSNSLEAGTTYEGRLVFVKVTTSDTNSIPGAFGLTAYFKATDFSLITSGVQTGVDIAVSQVASTNAVTIGDTFSYTITVTNRGTEAATSVVGSNDTSNVSVVGITGCGSAGQCDLGPLADAGASTSVVLTVTATGAGQACNTSSAFPNENDVNPPNNTSTVCIPVTAPNIPPTAVCRDVTNAANASCQALITPAQVDNGSSDDGTITNRTLNPAGPYNLGDTAVILTVTDNNGASDSCSATITVLDQTLPVVTCPGMIITNLAIGVTNAVVNFASTFSDNCSLVSSNCTPPSGSVFPLGTNSVTCTAVDGSGNTNTCSFSIIVRQLPAESHDIAVLSLKVPKKVTLQAGKVPKANKYSVTIQNNSAHTETITSAQMLTDLVGFNISSLATNCTPNPPILVPPKTGYPIVLAAGKKLKVGYVSTINCANDPLASTKTDDHSDYEFTVTVNHEALNGIIDTNNSNDVCPRGPNGLDKGCGNKDKATGQLGAPVRTDVVVKP